MNTIKKNCLAICLVLVVIASINTGCNTIEYVNRYYHITRCADPWHVEDATTLEYIGNATEYLIAAGYDVKGGVLSSDGVSDDETCTTCDCNTTDRLRLDVHRDDVADLETLFGFTKD